MVHEPINSLIGIKHIQDTVKKPDTRGGQKASAKKAHRLRISLAQLRNAQASGEKCVVKNNTW